MRWKTKTAQRLPEEYEELMMKCERTIIKMRQQNNYQIGAIGNMDETPTNFDMSPSRSVTSD